ncbi:MAG: elongation factor P [Tissierellia bacterium]|nr:elongation factor P [Tissierellia bacterium]
MISAGDFRKGVTFVMDGDVYQVLDFQHVKPGKGAAFVSAKIKNVVKGGIKDVTLNPSEKYEKAVIETKEMQYLYNDGELYFFMDTETYEQIPMNFDTVEDAIPFVKENDIATVRFYESSPFEVQPANFVELEVTHTEPGLKGDTSGGATKPATVETGYTLQVPLFIDNGDVIKIDTRTGEYLSRV